jgi:hypothetical protein
MKLYGQADRILVEETAIMPLTYLRRHLLVKPWVSKYPVSASTTPFWKDVIIELRGANQRISESAIQRKVMMKIVLARARQIPALYGTIGASVLSTCMI